MKFICKRESLNLDGLDLNDKMQSIFNHFNTNIQVIASKIDESTFSPIFQINSNGRILEIKVSRTTIEDLITKLQNYDKRYILYLEISNNKLYISSKKII